MAGSPDEIRRMRSILPKDETKNTRHLSGGAFLFCCQKDQGYSVFPSSRTKGGIGPPLATRIFCIEILDILFYNEVN